MSGISSILIQVFLVSHRVLYSIFYSTTRYALLASSKDVSRSHWSLPPHRRFLAVCEPLMGKVSVHAFWPSQHGVEYFVPMVHGKK